jgi:hypothetical protein
VFVLVAELPELQFLDEVLLYQGVLLCLVSALVRIVGADHGGSFALGSLLRIVAACPGNWSRDESFGSFGVKRMFMWVSAAGVLQRGVRHRGPMGGAVGP